MRYQNLIQKEMTKNAPLISEDVIEEDLSALLRQVESATRRLKDFSGKLEENIEKWPVAVEAKEVGQGEVEQFTCDSERLFSLLSEATEHIDQLMMLEKSLQERITATKSTRQTNRSDCIFTRENAAADSTISRDADSSISKSHSTQRIFVCKTP
jgi:hypothetical protein